MVQIPRYLEDFKANKNDPLEHKLTSSFKSSGRHTSLLNDAIHWQTRRTHISEFNVGPGYYDKPDSWDQDTRSCTKMVERCIFVSQHYIHFIESSFKFIILTSFASQVTSSTFKANTHYERPWLPRKNGSSNSQNESKFRSKREEMGELKAKLSDIESIKSLPSFGM